MFPTPAIHPPFPKRRQLLIAGPSRLLLARLTPAALLLKAQESNANPVIALAFLGVVVQVWSLLAERARDRTHMEREQVTHALARANLVYAKYLDLHDEMGTLDAFVNGQLDPVTGRPFMLDASAYAQVVRGASGVYRPDLPSARSDMNRVESLWLRDVMAQEGVAPVPIDARQPVEAARWRSVTPTLAAHGIDPESVNPRFLRPFRAARAPSKTGRPDMTLVAGYWKRDTAQPFYAAV